MMNPTPSLNQWRAKNKLPLSSQKTKKKSHMIMLTPSSYTHLMKLCDEYHTTLSEIIEAIGTGKFTLEPFILDSDDPQLMECYEAGRDDAKEGREYNFKLIFGDMTAKYETAYKIGYLEMQE